MDVGSSSKIIHRANFDNGTIHGTLKPDQPEARLGQPFESEVAPMDVKGTHLKAMLTSHDV